VDYAEMKECAGEFIAVLREEGGMAERVGNGRRMSGESRIF
jgi:hypothetical protein